MSQKKSVLVHRESLCVNEYLLIKKSSIFAVTSDTGRWHHMTATSEHWNVSDLSHSRDTWRLRSDAGVSGVEALPEMSISVFFWDTEEQLSDCAMAKFWNWELERMCFYKQESLQTIQTRGRVQVFPPLGWFWASSSASVVFQYLFKSQL